MPKFVYQCAQKNLVVVYLLVYRTLRGVAFKPHVYTSYNDALDAANRMVAKGFVVSIYRGHCEGVYCTGPCEGPHDT